MQLDGDFLFPRLIGHNWHFLNAYYVSGILHTWYLFNSHSGHTKKLFLLVDETETPDSGTCPESHTLQRQDRHWKLVSASVQTTQRRSSQNRRCMRAPWRGLERSHSWALGGRGRLSHK